MMVVGLITAPAMGWVMDYYGHDKLPLAETQAVVPAGRDNLARDRGYYAGTKLYRPRSKRQLIS